MAGQGEPADPHGLGTEPDRLPRRTVEETSRPQRGHQPGGGAAVQAEAAGELADSQHLTGLPELLQDLQRPVSGLERRG